MKRFRCISVKETEKGGEVRREDEKEAGEDGYGGGEDDRRKQIGRGNVDSGDGLRKRDKTWRGRYRADEVAVNNNYCSIKCIIVNVFFFCLFLNKLNYLVRINMWIQGISNDDSVMIPYLSIQVRDDVLF